MAQGFTKDDIGNQINISTNKSSPIDADKIGIWDTVGLSTAHTTFLQLKSYLGSVLFGRHYLPFGVYTDLSPFSASNKAPYSVAVDRNFTIVKFTIGYVVLTTNDGSNYWDIKLYKDGTSGATLIFTVNTIGGSANVWNQVTTSPGASVTQSSSTANILHIEVAKVGSPGNLYLSGPAMEISI